MEEGELKPADRPDLVRPDPEALLERALRAERRANAVIRVGQLFAEPRPVGDLLRDLAVIVTEDLADISLVHLVDERGEKGLLTTAVAARDPLVADAISAHLAERPIRFDEQVAGKVIYETRQGILLTEVTPDDIARLTRSEDAKLLEYLGLTSVIMVPLRGRERVIGTMDFVLTRPGRRYGPDEFDLAQEIADRAAAAVENARLVREVEQERARLAHVLDQMPEGVVIGDAEGKLVLANRVARDVEGFALPFGCSHVAQREEIVRRRSDGEPVPILVNSAPVRGDGGAIEAIVAVFQDVSERKRFEAQLAGLAQIAGERARRLEAIISCMADAVFVADASGRVVLVNDAAVKLAGLPRERLLIPLAEYPQAFGVRGPDGREVADPVGTRVMAGEVVVGAERVLATEGGERHLRLSAAPMRDEAGRVEGAVIVAVDMTKEKELERAKDEFLSVASHELKTPLTPMLSIAELISRDVERGVPVDPSLVERLVRQVRRLRALIGEMLDVARSGEGRLEIEREPFALRQMVEQIVEEYRSSAPRHEIAWLRPAEPATVEGDEGRIGEVIGNLLDNAVKYTPPGGRIEVGLAVAGGRAEVWVRDEGIGIPAEDLPHIFERFRRGRNVAARHYGGLGLGLFISREIVRLHGGEMRLESVEGKGTRVGLTLPVIS